MTHNTTRLKKCFKFMIHIAYLLFINYLLTQRSARVVSKHKIVRFLQDIKHILIWTELPGVTEDGQKHFIKKRCLFLNCYFTRNRSLFGDTRFFDMIVFNQRDVSKSAYDLPTVRTAYQRFVFAANESADNYPVCDPAYDRFFNWTWTYRLDSTLTHRSVTVYNIREPHKPRREYVEWIKNPKPISILFKNQLVSKSKAAAVFLDQCKSRSERENFVKNLQKELAKYNLTVDVFGDCGPMKCKKRSISPCYWRLRKNYFFYLALEDSFAADYMSEEVLHAYKNNVVPIVYGAAEYSRFLPPDSYLNAMHFREDALAKKMHGIMNNREIYNDFFRWKNHYVIEKGVTLNACHLCQLLNEPKALIRRMSFTEFRRWWNPWYVKRCSEDKYFTL